ncbi:MAG: DVUA0089 family protein [Acidobacteriaceae bacterium]|nr:DVUA0089 family protein [Acidobacteriaceae bacterium]
MLLPDKAGGLLVTLVIVGLVCTPLAARASNITLQDSFTHDDDVQLFAFTVATAGSVDLRSYGYAGGTIPQDGGFSLGVARGGFDTILTLFNASGQFLSENDDGAGVATDPATGLAGDARLTATLAPGRYLLALTQYDNFARGSNLADGFVEAGYPNFTAAPSFATGGACPGNLFRDISGTAGRCRTGNWTVDFSNVASVTPVASTPEPSALLLVGAGLALLLAGLTRRRRTATLLAIGLVAVLASGTAQAQTNCPLLD